MESSTTEGIWQHVKGKVIDPVWSVLDGAFGPQGRVSVLLASWSSISARPFQQPVSFEKRRAGTFVLQTPDGASSKG
jgi:hypothetical protein